MYQLNQRELWRRYRNREQIPIGFLSTFAAHNQKIWYGDFSLMRISYEGLWALYFDSQWGERGQSMKLVTIAYIEQLESYFGQLGISTKVLDPFKSLSSPINAKTISRNISHPIYDHKASPFCEKNDSFYRTCSKNVVDKLHHCLDSFYVADLIEGYDIKEEILIKTSGI
ncbi:hypothetical protein N9Z60_04880 [Gammaproteobacteria bacterium]|nr:hypothetical protein [Gammaproteobacteria bacterium]